MPLKVVYIGEQVPTCSFKVVDTPFNFPFQMSSKRFALVPKLWDWDVHSCMLKVYVPVSKPELDSESF